MKKIACSKKLFIKHSFLLLCLITLFSLATFHSKAGDSIAIIPKPLIMHVNDGHFALTNSTSVTTTSSNAEVKETIQWFIDKISTSTGYHLS
ncbi:MAG TPA: hypothetical protein VFU62_10250, partial [Hanamia sp.]|nr:hypothetical protein [Hanamia sp.]